MLASGEKNLWRATAKPLPSHAAMADGEHHDVIVVGGGIMGATAALSLAAAGVDCALLEADEFGAGASSRPGGFLVPHFTFGSPSEIIDLLGDQGEWLVSAVGGVANLVERLCRAHNIDCDLKLGGWYQPAHNAAMMSRIEGVAADWRRHGAQNEVLDGSEVEKRTGVAGYAGGWFAPNGGTMHPLKYTLGLIGAAARCGAKTVTHCPVSRIERINGEFRIETPMGVVLSDRVLVCTNATASRLSPEISAGLVRMPIWQCATEPLAKEARANLFSRGECLSDTRANLFTYRFDSDWRLVTGAMEPAGIPSARIGAQMSERLKRMLNLPSAPNIDFLWRGEASVTPSRLPEIEVREDGLIAATACNGRGIGLATIIGLMLAQAAAADDIRAVPYSFRSEPSALKVRFERMFAGGFPYYAMMKDAVSA